MIGQQYYAAEGLAKRDFQQWHGVQQLNQRQANLRFKAGCMHLLTSGPEVAPRARRAKPGGVSPDQSADEERRISKVRVVMFGPKAVS